MVLTPHGSTIHLSTTILYSSIAHHPDNQNSVMTCKFQLLICSWNWNIFFLPDGNYIVLQFGVESEIDFSGRRSVMQVRPKLDFAIVTPNFRQIEPTNFGCIRPWFPPVTGKLYEIHQITGVNSVGFVAVNPCGGHATPAGTPRTTSVICLFVLRVY